MSVFITNDPRCDRCGMPASEHEHLGILDKPICPPVTARPDEGDKPNETDIALYRTFLAQPYWIRDLAKIDYRAICDRCGDIQPKFGGPDTIDHWNAYHFSRSCILPQLAAERTRREEANGETWADMRKRAEAFAAERPSGVDAGGLMIFVMREAARLITQLQNAKTVIDYYADETNYPLNTDKAREYRLKYPAQDSTNTSEDMTRNLIGRYRR